MALTLKNTPSAVAFFFDPDMTLSSDPGGSIPTSLMGIPQKGKAALLNFDFSANGGPQYQCSFGLADIGLYGWQGLYIDNSLSPAQTTVFISGTNQTIVAAPYSQGYYRVMAGNQKIEALVSNYATLNMIGNGNVVPIEFLNLMPDGADVWNSQPTSGLQGTPFFASATGANSLLTVTMPNIAGRRSFITGIGLTGAGSTAGAAVNATLTNLDNGFAGAVTLNAAFTFPVGVLVPAQPIVQTFSPAVPGLLGAAPVLSLPAGGAGNTLASIWLSGFYE